MMLEELDLDSYIEVLLGADKAEATTTETPLGSPQNGAVMPVDQPQQQSPPVAPPQNRIQQLMARVPILGKMLGAA